LADLACVVILDEVTRWTLKQTVLSIIFNYFKRKWNTVWNAFGCFKLSPKLTAVIHTSLTK